MSFASLIYRIIFSEQSDENKPFQQNVQVSRANKKQEKTITNTNQLNLPMSFASLI
jgi:hypothetical protein